MSGGKNLIPVFGYGSGQLIPTYGYGKRNPKLPAGVVSLGPTKRSFYDAVMLQLHADVLVNKNIEHFIHSGVQHEGELSLAINSSLLRSLNKTLDIYSNVTQLKSLRLNFVAKVDNKKRRVYLKRVLGAI